jgi:hypothetical protein
MGHAGFKNSALSSGFKNCKLAVKMSLEGTFSRKILWDYPFKL